MLALKSNKKDFSDELKQKFINVIEQVANSVAGLRQQEKNLITRFKKDVELI